MKNLLFTVYYSLFIFLVLSVVEGCSNPTTPSNNFNPSCIKFDTLCFPGNDTAHTETPVNFVWRKASCDVAFYRLEISFHPNFDSLLMQFGLPDTIKTDTSYYAQYIPIMLHPPFYWRIKAFYGTPVTDTFITTSFRFTFQ